MIPIKFIGNEKDTVAELCRLLFKGCKPGRKKEVDNWCRNNIIVDGIPLGLEDIIVAQYPLLLKIVAAIDDISSKGIDFPYGNYMINTLYEKRLDKKKLIESLDISVCPYCNRGYLNSLKSYKTYQIDHFFSKDDYPLLGASFYNLIPSCYACNHKKGKLRMKYSPHNPKYLSADELTCFDYWISDTDFIRNQESIHVQIDADPVMGENVSILELQDLYSNHKKEMQSIIRSATIYPEEYIDDVLALYGNLFESRNDVEYMIRGFNHGESNYRHQPLSKMKSDFIRGIRGEC